MNPKKIRNFVGLCINGINVIEKTNRHDKYGRIIYKCRCHCGIIFETPCSNFYHEKLTSCGCLLVNREGKTVNQRRKDPQGRWWVYQPGHPNSNQKGWIKEERLIMSNELHRPLKPSETIRHKNNIIDDNRIENLEIWEDAIPLSLQKRTDIIDFCVYYLYEHAQNLLSKEAIKHLKVLNNQDIKIASLKKELDKIKE